MSDKDFRPFDPIVPERDGPLPKGSSGAFTSGDDRRDQAPRDAGTRREPKRDKAPREPGGGAPWMAILCLVALVLVAGFAWQQSRVLADLNARFSQLSARIESTDESLNQSGATLGLKIREQEEKLAEHWTEIRKLWGVSYDTNRKAIAANSESIDSQKATIATLQANLKKAEGSLAALQKSVDTASKQAAEASKQAAAATQSVSTIRGSALGTAAQVEEIQQKMATLSSTLATTNNGVNQLRNDLTRRVAENEQAVRAMDSYRAQINQQLNQLRQQVGGAQ